MHAEAERARGSLAPGVPAASQVVLHAGRSAGESEGGFGVGSRVGVRMRVVCWPCAGRVLAVC